LPRVPNDVPATQSGRIRWIAAVLGRGAASIARGLGIGRSSLYRYLSARAERVDGIDDALMVLMARERIASQRRARDIAKAERAFAAEIGNIIITKDSITKDSK
jgi:hypothetical protein